MTPSFAVPVTPSVGICSPVVTRTLSDWYRSPSNSHTPIRTGDRHPVASHLGLSAPPACDLAPPAAEAPGRNRRRIIQLRVMGRSTSEPADRQRSAITAHHRRWMLGHRQRTADMSYRTLLRYHWGKENSSAVTSTLAIIDSSVKCVP